MMISRMLSITFNVSFFRTVIGDDGKVRMETRFQSSQPPQTGQTSSRMSPPKVPSPQSPDTFSPPKNVPKPTSTATFCKKFIINDSYYQNTILNS